jgi:bifunctional UDP-N-acetylglucosamine pyrophosphorylase/glucosamine-1-phosphate N-acetyltransferase
VSDAPVAAAIVLAAGQGTRMRSATPKVLHEIGGRSLLGHVLAAVAPLAPQRALVVVGDGREQVEEHLRDLGEAGTPGPAGGATGSVVAPQAVVQAEQRGTGHATRLALDAAPDLAGTVLVVPGDAPLLTAGMLGRLVAAHVASGAAATLLTAELPDPTGYGRIVRSADGAVTAIVEEADADDQTRAVGEVGTSVYAFDAATLREALGRIGSDNAQGEEYLTDVVALLAKQGERGTAATTDERAGGVAVRAIRAADHRETVGVNDRAQLAAAGRVLRDRVNDAWMRAGVTIVDPASTWIDVDVHLEADARIEPNTRLHGRTTVAAEAVVGPASTLTDTAVGAGAVVKHSYCDGADVGPEASVGPFTYLRPGTRLGPRAKAGAYVEIKNSDVRTDAKVPHLSYVGDAMVGERSNIGAATVFVNYDGVEKHRATVGDDARVGSDTMLVAPVTVGDGAYTAAGSVIDKDVPAGALGVGRARQRNVDGWVARKRPGTPADEAARRAGEGNDDEGAE